jgi:hypothetical protein
MKADNVCRNRGDGQALSSFATIIFVQRDAIDFLQDLTFNGCDYEKSRLLGCDDVCLL